MTNHTLNNILSQQKPFNHDCIIYIYHILNRTNKLTNINDNIYALDVNNNILYEKCYFGNRLVLNFNMKHICSNVVMSYMDEHIMDLYYQLHNEMPMCVISEKNGWENIQELINYCDNI